MESREEEKNQTPDPMLRKIYPEATDEQLLEAEDNLTGYIEGVLRIYNRICSDPVEYAKLQLLPMEFRKLRENFWELRIGIFTRMDTSRRTRKHDKI